MTKEKKLHWYDESKTNSTSCGREGQVAKRKKNVTCQRCRKILGIDEPDDAGDEEDAPTMPAKGARAGRSTKEKPHNDTKKDSELIPKKSLLDYAAEALQLSGEPMRCKDMVEYAEKNGWVTNGKTPQNTLNAAINKEIRTAVESRFELVEKGLYGIVS